MRSFRKMPNDTTADRVSLLRMDGVSEVSARLEERTISSVVHVRMLEEPPSIEREFRNIADEWRRDTGHLSTMTDILLHPAHFRIVSLGRRALPFIMSEVKQRRGHWFTALAAITGESIAADAMSYDQAVDAWLSWGRANGYVDARS